MKPSLAMGLSTGAIALILAGCSSSANDTQTDASDAVNNVAGGSSVNLSCSGTTGTKTDGKTYIISIPSEVTEIYLEAVGAPGGSSGKSGGIGGYASGTFSTQAAWGGELYAKVGCEGTGSGGFPNGGRAFGKARGGGGSTSVGKSETGFEPLLMAGGGGGVNTKGSNNGGSVNANGTGQNGSGSRCGGGGATQSNGGGGGKNHEFNSGGRDNGGSGVKFQGGKGGTGTKYNGGGGGGGYYGGGGGCGGFTAHGSGGAGSSWVDMTQAVTTNPPAGTSKPAGNPRTGSLLIKMSCADQAGAVSPCANVPDPTPVG